MPDGQRVVGDEAFLEYLAVSCAGLLRFGEVIGEVGSDQLLPRHPGHPHGGLVNVGDLPVRADGDQGVEARLDKTAGVLGSLLLGGDVAGGGKYADYISGSVLVF